MASFLCLFMPCLGGLAVQPHAVLVWSFVPAEVCEAWVFLLLLVGIHWRHYLCLRLVGFFGGLFFGVPYICGTSLYFFPFCREYYSAPCVSSSRINFCH